MSSSEPSRRKLKDRRKRKPLWETILSVFFKNLILLLVLVLLVQMLLKLAFNQIASSDDYDTRIAGMETFLKTTTKMMQAKIDSVDQNIRNQVHGLNTEISNQVCENGEEFSARLSELDGRVEGVNKCLTSDQKWVSKNEFDRFVDEFKEFKGLVDFKDLSLGQVKAFAKEIVEKEIEKHAADGLGMVDYAAASAGAMVVEHSDTNSGMGNLLHRNKVSSNAVKMLQPSFGEPGQCFPLKGDNGFVQVKLRTAIIPEAITLEHVAKSVAFDRSSAPKDCRVFGWLSNNDTMQRQLLTDFVYDLEKSNAQTFNVLDMGGLSIIDTIRLEFTSNHGNPTHTCIYRLRVHGQEPHALSSLALQ
ncbi:Sad1/UNC-like, C-terminal [Artemisia annua]|uniref:Sad1/UNC-like, C-terminal n=1 Tax=Artemisia annua TaxID=35608 RepID=A0A2U1N4W1_ARTAN|nr:Sad1/UNC-like, C-terminal [Artemisia annua]